MNKKYLFFIILFLLNCHICFSAASDGKGETVFPFLKINSSVRSSALAGSNAAVMEGIQSVFLNPAGLASIRKLNIYTQYSRWLDGINIGYLSLGWPFTRNSNIGINVGYMQYPKLKVTDPDTGSVYGYTVKNDFSAATGFGGLSYSGKLSESLFSGVNIKVVGEQIGSYASAVTLASDLGIIVRPSMNESYGLSINNISWGAKFKNKWEPLPTLLRAGGQWKYIEQKGSFEGWEYTLSIGGELRFKDGIYAKAGIEISPFRIILFRGGYNYALETDELGKLGGASFGMALNIPFRTENLLNIEYAIEAFGRLGTAHRIGVSF